MSTEGLWNCYLSPRLGQKPVAPDYSQKVAHKNKAVARRTEIRHDDDGNNSLASSSCWNWFAPPERECSDAAPPRILKPDARASPRAARNRRGAESASPKSQQVERPVAGFALKSPRPRAVHVTLPPLASPPDGADPWVRSGISGDMLCSIQEAPTEPVQEILSDDKLASRQEFLRRMLTEREQAAEWRRVQEQRFQQQREDLRQRVQETLHEATERAQLEDRKSQVKTSWKAIMKKNDEDGEKISEEGLEEKQEEEVEKETTLDKRIAVLRRIRKKDQTEKRRTANLKSYNLLDPAVVQQCETIFNIYDEDGSGSLELSEIRAAVMELGLCGVTSEERNVVTRCIEHKLKKADEGPEGGENGCGVEEFAVRMLPAIRTCLSKQREQAFKIKCGLSEGQNPDLKDLQSVEKHAKEVWPVSTGYKPVWANNDDEDSKRLTEEAQLLALELVQGILDVKTYSGKMSTVAERWQVASSALERQVQEVRKVKESTFRAFRPEIWELDYIFRRVDEDESGALSRDEIRQLFKELGVIPKNPQQKFELDERLSTVTELDFEQFLALVGELRTYREEQKDVALSSAIEKWSKEEDRIAAKGISRALDETGRGPKDRFGQLVVTKVLVAEDLEGSGMFTWKAARRGIVKIEEQLRKDKTRRLAERARDLGFSEEDFFKITKTFDSVDNDGSGALSFAELRAVIDSVADKSCSDEDLKIMICTVDLNGTGSIEIEEFMEMYRWFMDQTGPFDGITETVSTWQNLSRGKVMIILKCCGMHVDDAEHEETSVLRNKAIRKLGLNQQKDPSSYSNLSTVKDLYTMALEKAIRK